MADTVKRLPDATCPKCKLRFVVQFYAKSSRRFEFMQPVYCPSCWHRFGWSR